MAPASEYKIMLDQTRQVVTDRHSQTRVLHDYHSIFLVIQQHGDVGCMSWAKVGMLLFGGMLLEAVYRSLFTCVILNCTSCVRRQAGLTEEELEGEERRLEHLISTDYELGKLNPEE